MTFWLVLSCVALTTATMSLWAPAVVRRLLRRDPQPAPWWLPVVAAGLFVVAFWLPDVQVSGQTQTFQQHFVGGGLFCAALYAYSRRLLELRLRWWQDLAVLIAVISTLGVAAELGEFTLTQLGLARIGTGDTDWDLLANTTGALVGWCLTGIVSAAWPNRTGPRPLGHKEDHQRQG